MCVKSLAAGCSVLSSFGRNHSLAAVSVPPFAVALIPYLHVGGVADDTQPFRSCSVNNLRATASPVNLTQTWGSEVCRLEKDGMDEGRKSLKNPGLLHIGIRIPCGQLMSAGASQRVCHLWCRVDSANRNNWLKSLASVDTF